MKSDRDIFNKDSNTLFIQLRNLLFNSFVAIKFTCTVKGYNVMEQKDLKADFLSLFSTHCLDHVRNGKIKIGIYL